jgi:hypothetical protein
MFETDPGTAPASPQFSPMELNKAVFHGITLVGPSSYTVAWWSAVQSLILWNQRAGQIEPVRDLAVSNRLGGDQRDDKQPTQQASHSRPWQTGASRVRAPD